jgi:hypothetical protein
MRNHVLDEFSQLNGVQKDLRELRNQLRDTHSHLRDIRNPLRNVANELRAHLRELHSEFSVKLFTISATPKARPAVSSTPV